jgi:hypothetical protein
MATWLHIIAALTAKQVHPRRVKNLLHFSGRQKCKAFDQMKASMAADVLCAYPNHNKPFYIFTDVSDYQLGACIMQEGKPVACYSKKVTSAQMNYRAINKELLCVTAPLCKFCSMLVGTELHVHTDHKNILSIGNSSQQCLC